MHDTSITLEGRRVRGSFRDSVYFSILDDEWPEVKRRLEERLAKGAREAATSRAGSTRT